jgi:hypothetical protein
MYLIEKSLVVAAFMAFVLTVSEKTGFRVWLFQRIKNDTIAKLIDCDFCLTFHFACIVPLALQDIGLLLLPVCAATFVKFLR